MSNIHNRHARRASPSSGKRRSLRSAELRSRSSKRRRQYRTRYGATRRQARRSSRYRCWGRSPTCSSSWASLRYSHAANARVIFTLTLAALGLYNCIDSLGLPWSSLVTTLLLALLALAFFVVAHHSHDKRFGWLLSASVATGLAIADYYNLINVAPAAAAAVLVTFIAISLLVVRLDFRGS
jgi:hypothetical protein